MTKKVRVPPRTILAVEDNQDHSALLEAVFSSSNERRYADRAFALGARKYVFKPTGFQSLVSTVRRVLFPWVVDRDEPEEPPGVA